MFDDLEKAIITANWDEGYREYPVLFNPTEFTLDRGVQIAEIAIPGLDTPLLQFVRGNNETMSLDLFFDTTDGGLSGFVDSVTEKTDPIYSLTKIDPQTHAPPVCTFEWGGWDFPGSHLSDEVANQHRVSFDFIVESIKQKFTLFDPSGVPLRATLTLKLREYKTLDLQLSELNLQSPDRTHSHVIMQEERLSQIAAHHYKRPSEWRRIADENAIEDPRRLSTGEFLVVPKIES